LEQIYIYAGGGFIIGFVIAWIIRTIGLEKLKKLQKSTEGYLESETLKKITLQKENAQVHQMKQVLEMEYQQKLEEALNQNKILDSDILLLQKSNEETEAMLQKSQPALHALKLQLLEAQNTIARLKAQPKEQAGQ
jgi:uncharacterized membrane protein YhiD involved in acid resistance